MTDQQVLCKDCKYAKSSFSDRLMYLFKSMPYYMYTCTLPEAWIEPKTDVVSGMFTKGKFDFCYNVRLIGSACGPTGKNWVPKDSKNIFVYLKHKN